MSRKMSKRAAALIAGALALALAAPPAASAQTASEDILYVGCYIFTAGGDHTAIAYRPRAIAKQHLRRIYPEAMLQDGIAASHGYVSARCSTFETAAQTEAWYRASGYSMAKEIPYPKGHWPDETPAAAAYDPRGRWVACLKSHTSGVYVTPAFETNVPDNRPRLNADAVARWGSSDYVDCDYGQTREEVDRKIRNHYTTAPRAWPLPWGGQQAAAPPPRPAPPAGAKPAAGGSLTVKTDTSAKDAARAWDEQVKTQLAAEARRKVETAAKQAQADAKLKADYEAFFAERRKQGRGQ